MKRLLKICLIFLFGLLIMMGENSCMFEEYDINLSEEDVKNVEHLFSEYNDNTNKSLDAINVALSKKYNDTFEIVKVRNSTATNSIEAYVASKKYPHIIFDARVDRVTNKVTDNYLRMIVGDRIQQNITESLNEYGIQSYSKVTLSLANKQDITDTEIDVKKYLDENNADKIIVHSSIMRNTMDTKMAASLIKAVSELSKKYNVDFLFSGYLLTDDYEPCVNDMKNIPIINEPWYSGYNVLKRFYFSVKNGISTKNALELSESMNVGLGGELSGIFR